MLLCSGFVDHLQDRGEESEKDIYLSEEKVNYLCLKKAMMQNQISAD
jgi:hypothetical protein